MILTKKPETKHRFRIIGSGVSKETQVQFQKLAGDKE